MTLELAEKKQRIVWFDALKLFACLMIFFGHFNGVFAYGQLCERNAPVVFWQYNRFVKTILNGNFWICVFCFVSGFLIARKSVPSLRVLVTECFLRYLRFALQFLCAAFIAWCIYFTIGYPTSKYAEILENSELLCFYNYKVTFLHVIKTAFLFWKGLLPTIWMIGTLLLGNYIILAVNFLLGKFGNRIKAIAFITLSAILLFAVWNKVDNPKFLLCCLIGAVPGVLVDNIPEIMCKPETWSKIGDIPFSVYLLHMPIIYSFSLYFFGWIYTLVASYYLSYFICLIATFVVVVLISWLYERLIGRLINRIMLFIKDLLYSIG